MRVDEVLTSLKHPNFTKASIRKGLKSPQISDVKIFSLEGSASEDRPLLLIHGVSDSPRCFVAMLDRLGGSAYRPLFASYPTGLGFQSVCEELAGKLQGVKDLTILCHSMGGLIGYALSNLLGAQSLICISTPWGGATSAAVGSYTSNKPLWRDMAPKSDFLTRLESLPKPEEFHLIFGYRRPLSKVFAWPINHDGYVTLSSQLPLWVQARANSVRGFNCTHRSVLKNAEALSYVESDLLGK